MEKKELSETITKLHRHQQQTAKAHEEELKKFSDLQNAAKCKSIEAGKLLKNNNMFILIVYCICLSFNSIAILHIPQT